MYALPNKTQHKLIVKVRGGISQKIDYFNNPTIGNKKNTDDSFPSKQSLETSSPKPIFHTNTHPSNGKKSYNHRAHKQHISPDHHEMIKYVQQTWKGVEKNYEESSETNANKRTTSLLLSGTYYHNSNSTNALPNFTPFDLETFWNNRIMKRLTEE